MLKKWVIKYKKLVNGNVVELETTCSGAEKVEKNSRNGFIAVYAGGIVNQHEVDGEIVSIKQS